MDRLGLLIPYQDSIPAISTVKSTTTIDDLGLEPKLQSQAVETKVFVKTKVRVLNRGHEPARSTLSSRWSRVADDPNYALRRPAAVYRHA